MLLATAVFRPNLQIIKIDYCNTVNTTANNCNSFVAVDRTVSTHSMPKPTIAAKRCESCVLDTYRTTMLLDLLITQPVNADKKTE